VVKITFPSLNTAKKKHFYDKSLEFSGSIISVVGKTTVEIMEPF